MANQEDRLSRIYAYLEKQQSLPNMPGKLPLIELGAACEAIGDLRSAICIYSHGLSKCRFDLKLLIARGNAEFQIRDMKKAIADFTKVISIDPANPRYYYWRGLAHLKSWNVSFSLADFAASVGLATGCFRAERAPALYSLGRVQLFCLGEFAQAKENLTESLNLTGLEGDALFDLGVTSYCLCEYETANSLFLRCFHETHFHKRFPELLLFLFFCASRTRGVAAAEEFIRSQHIKKPNAFPNPIIRWFQGETTMPGLWKALMRYCSDEVSFFKSLFFMGEYFCVIGDPDRSAFFFKRGAITAAPRNEECILFQKIASTRLTPNISER